MRSVADVNKKTSSIPFDATLGGAVRSLMIRDRLRAEQEEADERAITQPDQHDTTKPAEERNLSADYAKFYTAFIKTGGRLPRKSIDKFFELREAMENRVFAECDVLFSTLNNIRIRRF